MTYPAYERRRTPNGSIICDNGIARLRVLKHDASLTLAIDVNAADGQWITLASAPESGFLNCIDAAGANLPAVFFTFEPLTVEGETRGVQMNGKLGSAWITHTCLLAENGTWTQHQFEIDGLPDACRCLTQQWALSYEYMAPELLWPSHILRTSELVWNPAALCQAGPFFAACVPDIEEDAPALGLHLHPEEPPVFEYGIIPQDAESIALPQSLRLAYALCLDAHALPARGFQQVVRVLGSRDALTMVGSGELPEPHGDLPALPEVPAAADWQPLMQEGTPEAIAALTAHLLEQAESGDLSLLEEALCWMDRLCLHQRTVEVPGGAPIGSFGDGATWEIVAAWMPVLLLRAFRLTGTMEYAERAFAALTALPQDWQAAALAALTPIYGDLYLHAEFAEVLAFRSLEILSAHFSPEEIALSVKALDRSTPLRVVMDGMDEQYTLSINGRRFIRVPIAQLRAGISVQL